MSKIKARIERAYQYIVDCWENENTIPTLREIAEACGIAKATVSRDLSILEAQGRISRNPYQSRGIRLTNAVPKHDESAEAVLNYLKDALSRGEKPSQAEIAAALYLSRGAVRGALDYLEVLGEITRGTGQRSIRLVKQVNKWSPE